MTTVLSLTYIRPKAQVRPSRHNRAMAPITQDLQTNSRVTNQGGKKIRWFKAQWGSQKMKVMKEFRHENWKRGKLMKNDG